MKDVYPISFSDKTHSGYYAYYVGGFPTEKEAKEGVAKLKKIGFIAGKSNLELKSDNTYTFTVGKKTYNGTYTFDANSNKLVMQGSLGLSTLNCTATVKSNELYMLFDADKLLAVATSVAGASSNLSSLSTLLKSFDGLKLGWTMKK